MQGSLLKPDRYVGLFSEHYVRDRFPETDPYTRLKPPDDIRDEIKRLYGEVEKTVNKKNESQLENDFIRPVLDVLGIHYIVSVTTPARTTSGTGSADYAFFPDEESRAKADARENKRYEGAVALADAKRWGRDFEGRGNALDENPNAVPTRQIANYITETGIEWGVLTDGRRWRLYNRNTFPVSQSYFEIDLIEALDDPELFHLFYAVFSGPAFDAGAQKFILDESKDYWATIGDDLKERAYKALGHLCNGFYANDREAEIKDVYEASVILLYRLLFVLHAESRELLPVKNGSYRSYSLDSILETVVNKSPDDWSNKLISIYKRLGELFDLINEGDESIGVYQYNGGLFKDGGLPFLPSTFLRDNAVPDRYLSDALKLIAYAREKKGEERRRVDYSELDVRHLGSIYEGLLESHPKLEGDEISLYTDKGERKATGSYYTPDYIVNYIVENTLGPLTEDVKNPDDVLTLKVLDPAMGSGHFLVGAIDFIGRRCLELAGSESEVSEEEYRRIAVEKCIYGVDLNPLAVELAKLSLWLHTITRDKPLSFLDHHLKLGNSLVGARVEDLAELPKKRKKKDEPEQQNIFVIRLREKLPFVLGKVVQILTRDTASIKDIEDKEAWLIATKKELEPFLAVADTWVSTYFGNDVSDAEYAEIVGLINTPAKLLERPEVEKAVVTSHGDEHRTGREFFHWELEFPEIFFDEKGREKENPGFDAVIGNPPYVDSENMIKQAPLEREYIAKTFDTAKGNWDLYIPFWELAYLQVNNSGRSSLITPNKWLSIGYGKALREYLKREVYKISDFSKIKVFEESGIFPVIAFICKEDKGDTNIRIYEGDYVLEHESYLPRKLYGSFNNWGIVLSKSLVIIRRILNSCVNLSDIGDVEEAFTVSEAYEIAKYLKEFEKSEDSYFKFVVTGTIDRYIPLWGISETRYIGKRYIKPVFFREKLRKDFPRRYGQAISKKIIISGIRHFESFLDIEGDYIAGKSTLILRNIEGSYDYGAVLAILNSRLITFYLKESYGALAMDGGINFTAPLISLLPIPRIPGSVLDKTKLKKLLKLINETEVDSLYKKEPSSLVLWEYISLFSNEISRLIERKNSLACLFLGWLDGETAGKLDDFRPKKYKNFWEYDFDEFYKWLRKNGEDFKAADYSRLQSEFEKYRADVLKVSDDIEKTDRLIDGIVYILYGLTDEEIKIVEGYFGRNDIDIGSENDDNNVENVDCFEDTAGHIQLRRGTSKEE